MLELFLGAWVLWSAICVVRGLLLALGRYIEWNMHGKHCIYCRGYGPPRMLGFQKQPTHQP